MGRYSLYQNIVMQDETLVYKQDGGDNYLFIDERGNWIVCDVAGNDFGFLYQKSNESPSPHKTIPWQYWDGEWKDDGSLKVYPCYD